MFACGYFPLPASIVAEGGCRAVKNPAPEAGRLGVNLCNLNGRNASLFQGAGLRPRLLNFMGDFIWFVVLVAAWVVLTQWVLPRFGVPT